MTIEQGRALLFARDVTQVDLSELTNPFDLNCVQDCFTCPASRHRIRGYCANPFEGDKVSIKAGSRHPSGGCKLASTTWTEKRQIAEYVRLCPTSTERHSYLNVPRQFGVDEVRHIPILPDWLKSPQFIT